MPKPKALPSQEYLQACFSYDAETGILRRKDRSLSHFKSDDRGRSVNRRFAGKEAGTPGPNGYLYVGLDYISYLAHRIIWKMVTGEEPTGELDHANGNRSDNRWGNLRPATRGQNCMNRAAKGYYWDKVNRAFCAQINFGGKHTHLGRFATEEEARAAYNKAAAELYGRFHRS